MTSTPHKRRNDAREQVKQHILRQKSWVFFLLFCSTDFLAGPLPTKMEAAVSVVPNALCVHARTIAPEHKRAHQSILQWLKHDFYLITQNYQ